jgi:uncharacterized protein DUF6515
MHTRTHKLLCSLFALLLVVVASQAVARDHSGSYHSRSYGSRSHSGYSHHHSYPARGYSTYHLPRGYYTSRYYGAPYYYHSGSWYRPYGPRYVVVAPPFGIGISVLPPFYSTVWFGGSPYYYADNTYYTYRPERREYVVTEPPRGSDEVFVYPKEGQSEERQSTDRDDCHRWAVARTGFDPAQPPGNVAQTDMTSKRVDYRRAEAACLEGRGYTVR